MNDCFCFGIFFLNTVPLGFHNPMCVENEWLILCGSIHCDMTNGSVKVKKNDYVSCKEKRKPTPVIWAIRIEEAWTCERFSGAEFLDTPRRRVLLPEWLLSSSILRFFEACHRFFIALSVLPFRSLAIRAQLRKKNELRHYVLRSLHPNANGRSVDNKKHKHRCHICLFPRSRCAWYRIRSSSAVHGPLLIVGSKWLCHLYRNKSMSRFVV